MKGRLGPDHSIILKVIYIFENLKLLFLIFNNNFKNHKVFFYSKLECKINETITISFRGGKPILLPFSVTTIIPKVKILESQFDFNSITTLEQSGELQSKTI